MAGTRTVVFITGTALAAATVAIAVIHYRRRREELRRRLDSEAAGQQRVDVVFHSVQELLEAQQNTWLKNAVTVVELHQPRLTEGALQHITGLPNLVRLDISGCGIEFLPRGLSRLSNLQVLLAPRNRLISIPAELGQLSRSLVQLDLGTNQLVEVPSSLCQLTNLRTLNLMANQLEQLPANFGRLRNLRLLGLKSNKLSSLPASFSQLTNLVELFITDNRLTDLPAGMARCTSLVKLQASFNCFTQLPACLLHLPRLELLRVAVCGIRALPTGLLESGALPALAWFSCAGNPACPQPPPPAPGLPVVEEDDLELGCKLGDGASGEVYRAVWRGQLVAVKYFRADVSPDGRTEDEVALAIGLQHPHLTQVLARVRYPPGLVLRLETGSPLAHKPTSQHLLRCKWGDDVRFAPRRALLLAAAVADALRYCHEAGVCHGDVYAHNVLMDEDENVTLCDFGASFSYDPKSQPFWQAMEVRAYGLMLRDVAQRCSDAAAAAAAAAAAPAGAASGGRAKSPSGGGSEVVAEVVAALRKVAEECVDLPPARRPSFGEVCEELKGLRARLLV
ncbi:hypothetical protein Agub_g4542 [Astrephomene gubernaculifera]|uniref:Protein kinase domain-containing protein n=1 Tax=Astrephomene gubernaculifera TaxID=47775 RepID=A0AAD3HJB7_9CHLO|nr:hypothetical protein Agub_g4542 [Astrephomene gubernaculifera]